MKAIDKAWEINLKLPKSEQFESKECLGGGCCPHHDKFNLCVKGTNIGGNSCEYYDSDCYDCWNSEVIE